MLLLSVAVWVATFGAVARSVPSTIDVDEIKPGMKGYGLSVLRGTEPERFDVEVIDILHDFRPGQALILAKTPHPLLNRARGVGGMSGSPIYFNGRLAGAYAYGWPYGIDPVIGITPIRNMLSELTRPLHPIFPGRSPFGDKLARNERQDSVASAARRWPTLKPYRGDHPVRALSALHEHRDHLLQQNPQLPSLQAAQTPIMLGGLTEDVASMLADELTQFGLVPTTASAGNGRGGGPSKFVDGGSIAVQLARGDIAVTGVGTVTHVTDRRLVAFGHPMMNMGQLSLPTATSRVLHILVSTARSFKIAEAIRPLGTLIHDRQPAIVVDTKVQPHTIPLHVRVKGVQGAPKTDWKVWLADDRMLTPMIAFTVIRNALQATASDAHDALFRSTTTLKLEGRDPVTLHEVGYSTLGISHPAAVDSLRMFDVIDAAYGNVFETVRIEGIDVTLDVDYDAEIFQLVQASVPFDEVEPGAHVPIYLRMRQRDLSEVVRTMQVRIPENAAGQTISIAIRPGYMVRRPLPIANGFDDLLEGIRNYYPATSVIASVQVPSSGLRFRGHVVDRLPPSALDALRVVHTTNTAQPFETREHHELSLDSVVVGTAMLKISVKNGTELPGKKSKKGAPKS